jgi:Outer membrane protein Omp28/Secretion system C-terminal sorting domain
MFKPTKFSFIMALMLVASQAFAQGSYKRYPTLEHFTNSFCSTCASRNPALFTFLTPYAGQYHHMTIHPNVPYQGCMFYQANIAENTDRKVFYSVNSTPNVFLNGKLATTGASLVPAAAFTSALAQTSPVGVKVTETTGATRDVKVSVFSQGGLPAGDYVLRIALVEKQVTPAMPTPNGEAVHHNVFRKFLTPKDGISIPNLGTGADFDWNGQYTIASGWNAAEMYVIAIVQNNTTKEVINSGTRFDPSISASSNVQNQLAILLSPNPATNMLNVQTDETLLQIDAFNLQGKQVFMQKNPSQRIDVSDWKSGVYLVRVTTRNGTKAVKVVVEN